MKIFDSIRQLSKAIGSRILIDGIRLLSILFAFSASAAIETAPNWTESEPPIRFKSRDWADAVLAAASTNSSIAIEGGRLLTNTTWDATKTHLVFNTVYIPSGITLTISEGAIVKFCPGTMIKVEDGGKLNIIGASGNDVILTAANDATVGEVIAGFGEEAIDFDGIRLQSSGATFTDNSHLETRGFNYGAFPTVSVLGTEAVRNGGVAYIPFTLSGSSRETAFSIEWEAIEGTAKYGDDYTLASGTISWGKSSEGTKTLQIPLNAANVTGEERTFTVRIKAARGLNIGTRTATVKIVERDALTLEWAPNWSESEPPIRFKSRDWADAVLAAASTNDAIAIEGGRLLTNTTWDSTKTHLVFTTVYVPSGITLTISEGAVVKFCPGTMIKVEDGGKLNIVGASGNDVILTAANDVTVGEVIAGLGEESFAFGGIRLQSSGATFVDNGWLETRGFNYGGYPSVKLNDSTAFRSSGLASIPVTISGTRDQTLTIDWVAEDGTAKYGEDYTVASGRITWGKASEGTKTISIPLVTSHIVGATTSFKVKIVTARGANIADGECTVSIREFDTLNIESGSAESTPPIRFKSRDWADAVLAAASTNDAIAIEGGRLLANTTWDATKTHLVFNTVYVPSGITLTISEGAVVKFCPGTMIKVEDGGKLNIVGASGNDVILTAANDATVGEAIEGFEPEHSIAFDGIRLQSTAATFTDNGWLETRGFNYSSYPNVTLHDATANRKAGMVYLPVTVGGTTRNQSFTVDWVAEDESAQFGRDYATHNSGRLTWSKSGDGTKYITIPLVTTETAGSNRTFKVRFVVARGVNVTDGEATVTIAEFAFDGLNGQPVEITSNAVSSAAFAIKESIGSQPVFLNDVEQVRYSGKWQTYDKNDAAALRVTVDSDNGTKVLKECSVEETGSFELRQSDYATGFYTLKHEILNNLGETLATMKKSFSIIDTEDVELHGGILTKSETWSADKVHVVYETVTVPAAYTLFIEPGAIVKFMTGTGIDISQGGALFANKIVFTHINDDTIGGDTLSDGYTVAPPMDAYTLSGNFTFGDDTELRNITQNTALAGTISTRKVLSRGSTYRVSGTLTIANGGSLTIPPGTVLKMESGASIVVNSGATLTAVGTRAAPIIITSIKDDSVSGDTNGDGDKTMPQPGDWEEIKNNGGTVNLAFVSALYGGYGQYSNQGDAIIRTASGTTTMDCCVVMHSNLRLIGRTGGTVSAVNCILQDGRWGIDGAVTFVNGVIADCNAGANGATVRNSILWECDTYASGGAISDCVCWGVDSSRPQSIAFNEVTGNIWGDPLFVDPDNGDFRIQEGSPCVDAADSSVAPEFDYYGQPRITVTEQGTNTVGQLADIGICELMPRNVTSDIDLVPQNVRTVTNAVPGELLFVKWEVKNAGGRELEGAWRDTVSLVSNNGREVQLGVKTTSGVIAPGGSIFCSGYFTIPPISEGEWYPKVNVNSYRDVFEGALGVNNALVGDRALTVKADALDPSVAREGVIGSGAPSVIKLTFGADDENRMVKFDVPAGVKVTWGFGFMPQGASQSGSVTATDGGVMFRVPEGATDVYVVLESDKTATYEMTTESTKMVITGVTPNTLPASGTTTLVITGAGFSETNAVKLVCGSEEVLPKSVLYVNPETIIIVVEGDELIQGENYDLQIAGLNTVKVDDVLTVVQIAKKGKLQAKLDVPSIIREGRITTGYIEYENIGDGDMYAPIFKLSNSIKTSEVMFSLEANGKVNKEKIKVVGLGSNYPKGILRAGEKCRVPFYFTLKGTGFRIHLSVVDMDSEELRESVYKTWKELSEAISQSATLVNGLNYSIYDYEKIYDNAMRKAYGQGFDRIAGKLVNVLTDMPMPDQTLYLVDSNDCAFAKSVTDMDGYFSFDGLCNGEKFSIISQTCQARYNDILVGEISNTELVIYGAGLGTVACKIGDVKPHKVFLTNRDTLKSVEMEKSDENVYLSEGLEDGEYVITPVFDGFYCSTNSILAFVDCGVMTNAQVIIEAVPSGKLELNIINYDGLSVSGVVCTAFSDNLNYKSQVYCDEYGKATFNLPPSEYTFSFNNGFIGDTNQIKVTVGNMLHGNIEVKKIPFVAFPSFGQAPLKSNFRLVNTNGFNAIVSCSWDFENDGVYDATGICVTNNYNDIGEYSVKCRIGFSDGSSKEFVHQNVIETFEAEKNEGVNGSLVLDDSSGYQISYTDDQKITLSVNNNAIPRYIAEGSILIVPNDDMRPRKVLEIATLDKYTIDVKTEFVSPMVAYNNAILRFNGQKMRGIVPDAVANLNVDDGGNIGLIGTVSHDFGACEISLNLTGAYTYNFAILIRDGKIKKLEHQSGFTGEFEVEGKIHSDDEKEKDKKQIYRISRSSGPKKKTLIDKVFPVGVVPFRLTARALLDAGLKGSFSASVFYGATIAYANGTWTDNYEKSFTPSFALEGEAYVKGGIELDGGIGIGKDILGTDFGLKVIGVSLEAGAKGASKVDINFSETEPDEYEIWAGIYGEGCVDLLKVSLGEWFEGSLASCPFGEEWKLFTINWKSPIPDFSVTENGITEYEAPVTMKSTTKSDYNLSERRWEIGGVNYGSAEALTHVFRCYPDDYVTYTVKLYEKYELGHDIFAWVPRFAKVRSKDIRLKGATSDDEDGDMDVDDSEGSGATSYDPNEMAGPLGLGDPNTERFVKPGEWMTYTVYFENMTNATAAAQEVYVTNPLSEWLDWSTFEMGEVSFGNQIDLGLSGKSAGTTEKRMDGTNWIVRTELSIEPDTTATDSNRQQKMCAKWYLRIVDPTTSTGWPVDPVAGFLPPNNPDTHCGEGHLTYRIKLRDDAPSGLVITNSATIVFDYNDPITTDPAWWNTVMPATLATEISPDDVTANEGESFEFKVFGGNLTMQSSVQVQLAYNTAAAADINLKELTIDGAAVKNAKFPLTLTWAAGEIGEKTISVPVAADKATEADEFFTLQLADPKNMSLGDVDTTTVTIHDPGYDALKAKVDGGTATSKELSEWFKLHPGKLYVRPLAAPATGGKVSGGALVQPGKKASLKATANAGYVFAGWYTNAACAVGQELVGYGDYRNPSLAYLADELDVDIFARFIPVEEDYLTLGDNFLPSEITTNAQVSIYVPVESASLPDIKVSGLPSGLKFYAKETVVKATKTTPAYTIAANTIYGIAPKRATTGPATVTVTVKNAGKYAITRKYQLSISEGEAGGDSAEVVSDALKFYSLAVDLSDDFAGKVTGPGVYQAGKKVTVKATANKGYVFNGWYMGEELLSQAASYSFTMPETDVALYAKFVTAEEDAASIALSVDALGGEISPEAIISVTNTCGVALKWSVAADALSQPVVAVTGLPSGLKFTAKDIMKKGSKTEIDIPANTIYGAPTAESKLDAKTGLRKPSAVKFTVTTAGKSKRVYPVDMTVLPLPDWAVGTFNGGGDLGQVSLTVAKTGKLSGKYLSEGLTWSLAADCFDSINNSGDVYRATLVGKSGKLAITNEVGVACDAIGGYAESELYIAFQNNWKLEPWKTAGKPFAKAAALEYEDSASVAGVPVPGVLTLKFAASGAVTVKGSFVTGVNERTGKDIIYTASGSAVLAPQSEPDETGVFDAVVFVYLPPKAGNFDGYVRCIGVRWTGEGWVKLEE